MAVDEAARHQRYSDLESALGPEPTSTLMSLLPPVGWADVATKQDLRVLENGIRAELHQALGALRAEMHQDLQGLHTAMRTMLFSMLGAMFTLAGLTWAATSLA